MNKTVYIEVGIDTDSMALLNREQKEGEKRQCILAYNQDNKCKKSEQIKAKKLFEENELREGFIIKTSINEYSVFINSESFSSKLFFFLKFK